MGEFIMGRPCIFRPEKHFLDLAYLIGLTFSSERKFVDLKTFFSDISIVLYKSRVSSKGISVYVSL